MKTIAIIGAGGLGATAAALLSRMQTKGMLPEDIHITMVDKNDHVFGGAIDDANIYHRTGLEYLRPQDLLTGTDCIHGGIAKDLLCGDIFGTGLPNRFWVSNGTDRHYQQTEGIRGWDAFLTNAANLRDQVYTPLYDQIVEARGRKGLPLVTPQQFSYPLSLDEADGLHDILGGYGTTGGGVVMAYDYAQKRAAIRQGEEAGAVTLRLGTDVTGVQKVGEKYKINGTDIEADVVLVTAAHQIPRLAQDLNGTVPPPGTYHLNGILYAKLPATPDPEMIRQNSRVNFVIQGERGCMFAPILAPTATDDGLAAIYFPSKDGCQVERHRFQASSTQMVPTYWDKAIKEGLSATAKSGEFARTRDERIDAIVRQVTHFNPFLKDYLEPQELRVRTVFNPVSETNPDGMDRRVRRLLLPTQLSDDGQVLGAQSPKWTTLEMAALNLIEQALKQLGMDPKFPRNEETGLGPNKLDVEQISRTLNLLDVPLSRDDALDYSRRTGQPDRIVDTTPSLFIPKEVSDKGGAPGGLGGINGPTHLRS